MYNQPSQEMKCESMPIIFFITSVVKDLKNFITLLLADILAHPSFDYLMVQGSVFLHL